MLIVCSRWPGSDELECMVSPTDPAMPRIVKKMASRSKWIVVATDSSHVSELRMDAPLQKSAIRASGPIGRSWPMPSKSPTFSSSAESVCWRLAGHRTQRADCRLLGLEFVWCLSTTGARRIAFNWTSRKPQFATNLSKISSAVATWLLQCSPGRAADADAHTSATGDADAAARMRPLTMHDVITWQQTASLTTSQFCEFNLNSARS